MISFYLNIKDIRTSVVLGLLGHYVIPYYLNIKDIRTYVVLGPKMVGIPERLGSVGKNPEVTWEPACEILKNRP